MDAPVVAASVLLRALSLCVLLCLLGTAVFYLLGQLDEAVSQHRRDMNARAYRTQLYFDQREALLNYLADSVVQVPLPEDARLPVIEGAVRHLPLGQVGSRQQLQLLLPARAERTLRELGVRLIHVGPGTDASGRWLSPVNTETAGAPIGVDATRLRLHAGPGQSPPQVQWLASPQAPGMIHLYRAIDDAAVPQHWLVLALDAAASAAVIGCGTTSACALLDASGQPVPATNPDQGAPPSPWLRELQGDRFGFAWLHGLSLLKGIGQDDWRLVQHVRPARLLKDIGLPLAVTLLLCAAAAVTLRALTLKLDRQIIGPARDQHRQLLESFHFGSTVVEMAPVGICVLRCHDGQIMLENQLARDWLGADHRGEDWNAAWRNIARSSHASTAARQARDFTTHDGRELQVLYSATRYHNEDVLLCVFNDISRHRQIQAALANAKLAADNASKAKSAFVATMSHEIRTPLHGLLGTLELLAGTSLDPRQARLLETLQQSSAVLLQLISNVLDVSRIESGQLGIRPAPFCPLDLAETTLRGYADAALRKQLQIMVCTDPTLPMHVTGDADRIRQILGNLLSNAIKFTDSGRIVMRVWPEQDEAGTQRICWQVTDTGVGIPVAAQAHLFKPFQQVEGQHRAEGSGLGLSISRHLVDQMHGELQLVSAPGLGSSFTIRLPLPSTAEEDGNTPRLLAEPVVYVRCPVLELTESACQWLQRWGATARPWPGLMQAIEPGAILVDSDPGGAAPLSWSGPRVVATPDAGDQPIAHPARPDERIVSLFSIRAIAAGVAQLQQRVLLPAPTAASRHGHALGLQVLVVEDNPINRLLLQEQLEVLGCQPTLAADGREALACCRARDFDVILSDINMPRLDGYALARRLRAVGISTPIIGATANATPEVRVLCREAGMDDCLFKPITLQALQAQLVTLGVPARPAAQEPALMPASCTATEALQVPADVLQVFLDTMHSDISQLGVAMAEAERPRASQLLHRIRGALVVVSAVGLADAAQLAEQQVAGAAPWADAIDSTNTFVFRLEGALRQLETAGPVASRLASMPAAGTEDADARNRSDR